MGKPLTTEAVRPQLDTLAALGVTRAIAAIHDSIANDWQGIYEPQEIARPPGKDKAKSVRFEGCFPADPRL